MNIFTTKNHNLTICLNEIVYVAKHFNRTNDDSDISRRQTNKIDIMFKSGAIVMICCKSIKERDEQYDKLIAALKNL